jgi:hypothetical protein
MDHIKGYRSLAPELKDKFVILYRKHLREMDPALREKHSIEYMKQVKYIPIEKCFEIVYRHRWYKYFLNGKRG